MAAVAPAQARVRVPAAALALVACQPPGKPKYDDITFTHLPPIELNVADIIIEAPYQEPLELPHVGEQFPVSPSRAARSWAEDRLRAVGGSGTVTVTIVESGAVETDLARCQKEVSIPVTRQAGHTEQGQGDCPPGPGRGGQS